MGLFSFPEEIFGKYKDLMQITEYERLRKTLGTDPRKEYKRLVIN
jgi:hypothetical protein